MNTRDLNVALMIVLTVGAANQDATPEQRKDLKAAVQVIREEDIPFREACLTALSNVRDVMGEDWQPEGEWREVLEGLLKEA